MGTAFPICPGLWTKDPPCSLNSPPFTLRESHPSGRLLHSPGGRLAPAGRLRGAEVAEDHHPALPGKNECPVSRSHWTPRRCPARHGEGISHLPGSQPCGGGSLHPSPRFSVLRGLLSSEGSGLGF